MSKVDLSWSDSIEFCIITSAKAEQQIYVFADGLPWNCIISNGWMIKIFENKCINKVFFKKLWTLPNAKMGLLAHFHNNSPRAATKDVHIWWKSGPVSAQSSNTYEIFLQGAHINQAEQSHCIKSAAKATFEQQQQWAGSFPVQGVRARRRRRRRLSHNSQRCRDSSGN